MKHPLGIPQPHSPTAIQRCALGVLWDILAEKKMNGVVHRSSAIGNRGAISFTLIELLVVVAVIAILAALLLPALQGAKERARRAQCMANQKQVAMAVHLYVDEYNGWLNNSQTNGVNGTWFYLLTNQVPKSYEMVHYGCPDAKQYGWWASGINLWFTGGDWWPSNPPTIPTHSIHEVKHPGQVFLVSCCYSPYGGGAWWDISVDGPYGTRPRHRGEGLNFVFVDGHGEWLKNRQWYTYPPAYEWCSVSPLAASLCSSLLGD